MPTLNENAISAAIAEKEAELAQADVDFFQALKASGITVEVLPLPTLVQAPERK